MVSCVAGVLQGSATAEQDVLALMDTMRESGAFDDVRVRFITESGRGQTLISFGIEFEYIGEGGS